MDDNLHQCDMSSLADTIRMQPNDAIRASAPRAEEENGLLTVYHDRWPVIIDESYDELIRFFGYNPEHWTVHDPGKMSKWQQSKGNSDGSRDCVWLYSYKGVKFRKKTGEDILTENQLDAILKRARKWKPPIRRTLGNGLGIPETYVSHQGDEQAGKSEGGGLAGLAAREEQALENTLDHIRSLMHRGVNLEAIADVSTGDRIENIFGHYNSQARTTATLRKQFEYAIEAEVQRIKALADFGLPIILPRTPSNHGEIRQVVGQAPFTSASDNYDLIIAEQVRRILRETIVHDLLEWLIPHDEYLTKFTASGVNCGMTHGHTIKGSGSAAITKWTKDQRDYFHFHEGFRMRLVFMGHFHHHFLEEVDGTTVIMTSTLDGGSPYMQAMKGTKSTPGHLGMTVGLNHPLGYGNLTFL